MEMSNCYHGRHRAMVQAPPYMKLHCSHTALNEMSFGRRLFRHHFFLVILRTRTLCVSSAEASSLEPFSSGRNRKFNTLNASATLPLPKSILPYARPMDSYRAGLMVKVTHVGECYPGVARVEFYESGLCAFL